MQPLSLRCQKGQEFMTYDGRRSSAALRSVVSTHNIMSRSTNPPPPHVCVCVRYLCCHMTMKGMEAMCVTQHKRRLSLLPSIGLRDLLSPVVRSTRLWGRRWQNLSRDISLGKGKKKNVSCLTCLSQLKCLHLKQNYSIVSHNELQGLRSLPPRHKRYRRC